MKAVCLVLLVLAAAGCANKGGYVQFHDGEALHPSEKAIVQGYYGYRNGSLANEMIRIVAIDGEKVPKQWFVAEGANKVSLLPGYYDLKILYVHGVNIIDYYSYITIPVSLRENCTYQIITSWSSQDRTVLYDLMGKPSVPGGNTDCGMPVIDEEEEALSI